MPLPKSAQDETKSKAADDPRMTDFKGKNAKMYQDSKENWPVQPTAPPVPDFGHHCQRAVPGQRFGAAQVAGLFRLNG
jgi:hypothetical protein